MSTVYGIVKQNDGYISVYSEPGRGATFRIYFPQAEGEISHFQPSGPIERKLMGCETVLVVEDEPGVRSLICRILRQMGCHVLEASDVKEALRIAGRHDGDISLVVTDVVMPEMSGREMVSLLQATHPGTKALYLPGYTSNAIVRHGVLDSDVAFLQKPFTIETFSNKVLDLLCSEKPNSGQAPDPSICACRMKRGQSPVSPS